jgi:transaldolase
MTTTPRQQTRPADAPPADLGNEGWAWPTPWIEPAPPTVTESAAVANLAPGPSVLHRLYDDEGQSLWLDHLTRADMSCGGLGRRVAAGIRGITANPAVLARALETCPEYDEQLSWLLSTGCTVEEAYRELAATDVLAACALLRPVHETSQGVDGFVSIEVAPTLARSTRGAMAAARRLQQRIDRPNLLVAIPATMEGVPAIQATVAAGRNIHAASIFSNGRYAAVIDAYLSGLEVFVAGGGDPSAVHGVASFSLSPVDAEVDRRLDRLDSRDARELRGLAAVAQAKLAYRLFEERFSTQRWARLARCGAHPQRLLWASAGTDLQVDPISTYVEDLIAPNTVHTLTEATVAALEENGLAAPARGIDAREAAAVLSDLAAIGIDLDELGVLLEDRTADLAQRSLDGVLERLSARRVRR